MTTEDPVTEDVRFSRDWVRGSGGDGGSAERTAVQRIRDAAASDTAGLTILTVYLVLLLAIPSRLVVGPLGGAGTPAGLWGLFALLFWLAVRFGRLRGPAPTLAEVERAVLLYAGALLVSYIAGATRPAPANEIRAADRALISALSMLGIVLTATDGLGGRSRLEILVKRLVTGVSTLAAIGILQFFTGLDVAKYIVVPGLSASEPTDAVVERSHFVRPQATSTHPIEFGVVLALALPLALYLAFSALPKERRRSWAQVILIGVAVPMTVSRSAVLGVAVAGLVLVPTWSRRRIVRTLIVLPIFLVAMRALVPGLLGTIRNLFTSIGSDSSTTSRTTTYGEIGRYLRHSLWFGRGPRTFLPENYFILDNQYLLTLVESGILGLVALVLFFGTAVATARRARADTDPRTRELGQCLAASVAVGIAGWATFDAFSFPMASGMIFLVIGMCGALGRCQPAPGSGRPAW